MFGVIETILGELSEISNVLTEIDISLDICDGQKQPLEVFCKKSCF